MMNSCTTPIYNKLFYNSRGQLGEIRVSTSYNGPTDTDADRDAIINDYSDQCSGMCSGSGMTDNNGNLKKQDIVIPNSTTRSQQFEYDSLNRLLSAREVMNNTEQWKQQFTYDRWGNRTIDTGVTYGTGINNKAFTVYPASNRLGPVGQSGTMSYDAAGNLTNDTYTGAGNRTYDAENKIVSAWGGNNQAQLYVYDASGQRIKRIVDGAATVQVYGFGGELLAEYAANGPATSPQKEYGYRNGQLLITAEPAAPAAPSGPNFAAASNGATATASSTYSSVTPANANNGDHVGTASWWADNTSSTYPDWLQVEFAGSKIVSEIDVYGLQQNYGSPVEPTLTMTSPYALTNFEVQYWTGSAWATVSGGSVTGNDKVWRKFTFTPLTTSKIRVYVTNVAGDNRSQVVELEAYGPFNLAATSNGATATASSTYSSVTPANANNGDHVGTASWWADDTSYTYPDWLQVEFAGATTIGEIDVYSLQQNYGSPVEPTLTMTSPYALTNFEVQYWTGSAWATVSGGSVTGNDKVWRKFTFTPLTTSKIRVYVTNVAGDNHSQVVELEAYTGSSGASIQWLVTDQLGTPRMIVDQSGSLANVKRHDYFPFGEELFAGAGGRNSAQGYAAADGVRQQFTAKERDIETALDCSIHRYYSPIQGRFTSPDVPFADQWEADPQSWNLYAYVGNDPTNVTDPFGLWKKVDCDNGGQCWQAEDGDTWESFSKATGYSKEGLKRFFVGETITSGQVFDVGGFVAWTRSLDNKMLGFLLRDRLPEFEPGVGGGLRDVSKEAAPAAAGLLARLGRWLGFGKQAAPVAQEGVVALRQAYEAEVRALATKAAQMKAAGHSLEEIAIEVHAERCALGIKYKDVTPPEILEKIWERNLRKYGDKLGPSIDWLRKQGKSWEDIIESASRPGGEDLKP